ncbi:MAG TPA: dihydrofolate reductase family protein [Terrimesophilobacter sp.]|nr:dihydrofolate reductase family protein [Terrimesophilobacter sp.]
MSARFVYWMNVSLDLFIGRDAEENGGGDWLRISEPLHREFNRRARALSMDVSGRVIYEVMEEFWPAARTDESLPDYLREYGEIWVDTPKVLVSRTRVGSSPDFNTRVIGGDDLLEQLAALKAESDGDIGVGGANLATQLLKAGLLDELLLFIHPVILGSGRPLFDGDVGQLDLDLLENTTYDDGVVLHRYAVRGAGVL